MEVTTFGQMLRERRRRHGVSLRQLGDALGFTIQYVSDVELGKRPPFAPTNHRVHGQLAVMLGLSAEEWARHAAAEISLIRLTNVPVHVADLIRALVSHSLDLDQDKVVKARRVLGLK